MPPAPVPSAVIVVPSDITPDDVSSMPTTMVPLDTAVTVNSVPLIDPVKTAVGEFHVWLASTEGKTEVTVPLTAESVVKAPVDGVVLPMAGGAAKVSVLAMVPEAAGAVSVTVDAVGMPESWKTKFLDESVSSYSTNLSSLKTSGNSPA